MRIRVNRKPNRFYPDPTRTILRFMSYGDERNKGIIQKVLNMDQAESESVLQIVLSKFAVRHRNVTKTLEKHYKLVTPMLAQLKVKSKTISTHKKLLIGSYFTMEYSLESAAFFNPSVVEAPDQYGLVEGKKRIIISFRAIGEGHISSIVFRAGVIDSNGDFEFSPVGERIEEASFFKQHTYNTAHFAQKLKDMKVPKKLSNIVLKNLGETFIYSELTKVVEHALEINELTMERQVALKEIIWLADSHYDIHFSLDTDISERVIFPVSETEKNGIEDARFVKFVDDNGKVTYYGTYTAYDGHAILPKMIETHDFYNFKIRPMHGEGAQNKNLALFPRKIDGKYVMLSRIDGINNYVSFSENLTVWENPIKIQEPRYFWEFAQIGNCGSPMETEKGWLVITHGVGPLRTYCLGASLFDLKDPTKELGRLREPLLVPRQDEMEGYVPNVVYTCGAIICHDNVMIPYGMSDYASSIVSVPLGALLSKILEA
ncbi:MAG: glycoside hydrolase family 130 protein [Bacteroidetes bacterium]|nr:glycoside hydrolase family 130 protein [Bacteroidota bacterium]